MTFLYWGFRFSELKFATADTHSSNSPVYVHYLLPSFIFSGISLPVSPALNTGYTPYRNNTFLCLYSLCMFCFFFSNYKVFLIPYSVRSFYSPCSLHTFVCYMSDLFCLYSLTQMFVFLLFCCNSFWIIDLLSTLRKGLCKFSHEKKTLRNTIWKRKSILLKTCEKYCFGQDVSHVKKLLTCQTLISFMTALLIQLFTCNLIAFCAEMYNWGFMGFYKLWQKTLSKEKRHLNCHFRMVLMVRDYLMTIWWCLRKAVSIKTKTAR